MRVLMICPSWGRACGIAYYTGHLRDGLKAIGVESEVVTHPSAIDRALKEGAFDGVLMQHEYGLYYFNLVTVLTQVSRSGLPTVLTMHNTDHRAWMGAQHLFLFREPFIFVVHSELARSNLLRAATPPDKSRLIVVPMGCPDYGAFDPVDEVRRELGLPGGGFVVGFFGFASAHKGIPNLVRAIDLIPDAIGYIRATAHPTNSAAVDEIYRDLDLPRSSPTRNVSGRVTLCHEAIPDDRVGSYQHAMDVIVLPYIRHGASISTSMQAHVSLPAGRPLVVTNEVYFSDFSNQVIKIPDPRPQTIARMVKILQSRPGACHVVVARATRYAQENSWPSVAWRYLDLLERARELR